MRSDTKLEERIWTDGILAQDETSLREIVEYVVKRLGSYLGRPIEMSEINVEEGVGGSCPIFMKSRNRSPIDVDWDGMVHVRLPEDFEEQHAQIYASLLGYVDGKRIGLQAHAGQSVLYMKYQPDNFGNGEWGHAEWQQDVYGEWEAYQAPSWTETS